MIRTLIVDDEPIARESIRILLDADREIEIVGESHGATAVDEILRLRPDLVFLDMLMPEMSGLELLASLPRDVLPLVVFVTAYDQYATRAFDEQAVDYLLKPYSNARFSEALQRAKTALSTRDTLAVHQELLARLAKQELDRRIAVVDGRRSYFFRPEEIYYIEATGVYVEIRTRRGVQLAREGIASVEKRLDAAMFIRVHRSAIVNVRHVLELRARSHGDAEALMRDGKWIPVSRLRRSELGRHLDLS